MYLITSAAYVSGGLETEYGKIPSSFLPLQNKRLFEHQIRLFEKSEPVILSLPSSFHISEYDRLVIDKLGIRTIYVPDGFTLGQSVIYVLNVIGKYHEPLRLLHGDTLITKLPDTLDSFLVSTPNDNYPWAVSGDDDKKEYVYTGFFSFSDQCLLIRSISESEFNFIKGILLYKKYVKVSDTPIEGWLDFGHLYTFYKSRTQLTTQRYFNDLKIDGYSVIKRSQNKNKILAEANWFNSMPLSLKRYLPALWSYGEDASGAFYQTEYQYLSTLSELFVFGDNELFIWKKILESCHKYLLENSTYKAPVSEEIKSNVMLMYSEKTKKRIKEYAKSSNIDLSESWCYNGIDLPSISCIIEEINNYIVPPTGKQLTIIHGDLGFSNIFYDFRTQSIKLIDPRALDALGNQTIYGDIRYDIAKLAHSVIGLYDFIIAGFFSYTEESKYNIHFEIQTNEVIPLVQNYFKAINIAGYSIKESAVYPIMIHLFLSMIPLHNDSPLRQKAMLANVFRLYLEFKE
jgi:hypothetical protein